MEAKILLSDMDVSGDLFYKEKNKKWYIEEGLHKKMCEDCGMEPWSYLFEIDKSTLVFEPKDVINALRRRNPWFYWQMNMEYKPKDGDIRNVYYKTLK